LTPNELDLSFPAPNDCAKFHQILFKIATVGAMTDRHTDRQTDASDLIICPMLCNSNGTDNEWHWNGLSCAVNKLPRLWHRLYLCKFLLKGLNSSL